MPRILPSVTVSTQEFPLFVPRTDFLLVREAQGPLPHPAMVEVTKEQETNNPCDPATMSPPSANGIGVSKASNGEYVGISDGKFAFDTTPNRRLGSATKCQASREFRAGNTQDAQKLWETVHREDTNDAEALIYLENQRVQPTSCATRDEGLARDGVRSRQ